MNFKSIKKLARLTMSDSARSKKGDNRLKNFDEDDLSALAGSGPTRSKDHFASSWW